MVAGQAVVVIIVLSEDEGRRKSEMTGKRERDRRHTGRPPFIRHAGGESQQIDGEVVRAEMQ